jgi:hypothetical protein
LERGEVVVKVEIRVVRRAVNLDGEVGGAPSFLASNGGRVERELLPLELGPLEAQAVLFFAIFALEIY